MDTADIVAIGTALVSLFGSIYATSLARRLEDRAQVNDLVRLEATRAGSDMMRAFADLIVGVQAIIFWRDLRDRNQNDAETYNTKLANSLNGIAQPAGNLNRLTYSTAIFTNNEIREQISEVTQLIHRTDLEMEEFDSILQKLLEIHNRLAALFQETYLVTNVRL